MATKGKGREGRPGIIIRREEAAGGEGHHGGAWKVAYADFVTAMMAFFLLMWLINATTEDQRHGLADYFSDDNVINRHHSGSGAPFGGQTPFDEGTLISNLGSPEIVAGASPSPPDVPSDANKPYTAPGTVPDQQGSTAMQERGLGSPGTVGNGTAKAAGSGTTDKLADPTAASAQNPPPTPAQAAAAQAAAAQAAAAETRQLEQAAAQLRDAVRADPALAAMADQLKIDVTPEGLRVQLQDAERRPMFASGSSVMNERARALLEKVGPVLAKMPESVSIAGHTDAAPYPSPDRTNWELSSERANATRRMLGDLGIADQRFSTVVGHADRDLLVPGEPLAPANRRITILVHRQTSPVPTSPAVAGAAPAGAPGSAGWSPAAAASPMRTTATMSPAAGRPSDVLPPMLSGGAPMAMSGPAALASPSVALSPSFGGAPFGGASFGSPAGGSAGGGSAGGGSAGGGAARGDR